VHGAFQGGWVWEKTAAALSGRGHRVHRPTLCGCGFHRHRPDAGAGLGAHISDIVQYLADEDLKDVLLVANSYSGLVCCGVAESKSQVVTRLVLVDGILPMAGKSFADMGGEPFRQLLAKHALSQTNAQGGEQAENPAGCGEDRLVGPWPLAMFGVPPEAAQWFQERLGPFPLRAFTEVYPGPARPAQAKRTYIRCTPCANPMLAAMAARAGAEGYVLRELASGHCAPACAPLELAELLHQEAS